VLAGLALLFTPLPRLERIPVRIFLGRIALFGTKGGRFVCGRVASSLLAADLILRDDFFFDFEFALKICVARLWLGRFVQVEVGAEIVFVPH
jgi:hypothetical protein